MAEEGREHRAVPEGADEAGDLAGEDGGARDVVLRRALVREAALAGEVKPHDLVQVVLELRLAQLGDSAGCDSVLVKRPERHVRRVIGLVQVGTVDALTEPNRKLAPRVIFHKARQIVVDAVNAPQHQIGRAHV